MKVVFLGTPDFAVAPLKKIIDGRHEVVAVVTQPDRPKGRSAKLVFSPVKEVALNYGIHVIQFEKISAEGVETLRALDADIFVTCAFGQILSQEIIDIPKYGIINIHASLLPKYRGAAPIQWCIINGEKVTGVTIMKTEIGVDTGDMIMQRQLAIGENETAGELFERLSALGADMINDALDSIEDGSAVYTLQDHSAATRVKMLKKQDGAIVWSKSAKEVFNLVRGMNPWPCAYTYFCRKIIKIWAVEICHNVRSNGLPGEVLICDAKNGIIVACGEGAVKISELQLEGAKRMSAKDFLLGRSFAVGERFTGETE